MNNIDAKFRQEQIKIIKDNAPKAYRPIVSFINLKEDESQLSCIRFIQDTATNWVPKVAFSRSKADFAESTFLEFAENAIVYCLPALIGENVFRKIFSRKMPEHLKKMISTPIADILSNKALNSAEKNKLTAVKAGISLACMCIPFTELSLNYVKNLLTLKIFKQADFNNIANLNKNQKEDVEKQKKVKDSAIKHIKIAGLAYLGCLGAGILLALKGHKSEAFNKLSRLVLEPGSALFKKNKNLAKTINRYFSLDFADKGGKLSLGPGQLTSCVLIGAFGYLGSAKDRGKQNFLEVLSRYPLVGFYVITGSELFEKGFKRFLYNKNMYTGLIKDKDGKGKDLEVPQIVELPEIAKNLAVKKGTTQKEELEKLIKGKTLVTGVPLLFSMLVMGFFVAGITRFWTAYRFKKDEDNANRSSTANKKSF